MRRGALIAGGALGFVLLLSPGPSRAQGVDDFVQQAARQASIPQDWVRAVLRIESGGDPHATSAKGAMGLMQIMPDTWRELRQDLNLGADPFDPHDNIVAGAAYLRLLHDRYGDAGFLAAYNAGPGRYDDHLATGRPLPAETRDYVASVVRLLHQSTGDASPVQVRDRLAATDWRQATLFAAHVVGMLVAGSPHPVSSPSAASLTLFVRRLGSAEP
ncbi:lytic transglycosylase domain-containing protein [Gluconacetobacter azotocaptans]|uniref:lytic transglycosylase domain-containing protein n=1 Tax=Gluconacetobacter azotocaptans TaxID=142834 RepID=UPI001958CFBF|nr:lytic transglycosylase domain-containing protein [Gluconacetobacter azotocaptans]MBM9401106.1 lytic transglycosylase domain-containing protein [Gluconacetobacter azotocaptans]